MRGPISTGGGNAARQYWFRGKITGDVDYMFGDAAAVFDHTTIYTTWHGTTATGTETIQAQNKAQQTGGAGDYLSGYVMNSDIFTSQSTGMTNLYFGRPYGVYSTSILLNSYIDQVNPVGYIPFSPPTLNNATYAEYNNHPYTDPSTGSRTRMAWFIRARAETAARELRARGRRPRTIRARWRYRAAASRPTIPRWRTPRFRQRRRSSTRRSIG